MGGTTINEQHRKDVFWWRFGENPSSHCWSAVASKEKKTQNGH